MARNDQIVRILTVARALAASRRGVALKTLAERLGLPWRSVYRDVEALERAGYPIEKTETGYRLSPDWTAPNLPGIESDEIVAFFAIRALTQSWRATALGRPLDRLWMKLTAGRTGQGTLVPVGQEPWFAVRSPIGIDYRAHDKTIAVFERAAREHLVVTGRYRALSTGQATARQIEPSELYWDPTLESLYVIGWCRLRNDVRVFALQRFVAAALTDETFRPRPEAKSKTALRNAFRVWRGSNLETVRIRFSAKVAPEIRERTWGPGQRLEEEAGGGVLLTLEVVGGGEVERWVLGFGPDAELLAPAGMRERLGRQIVEAAEPYIGVGLGPELQDRHSRRPAARKVTQPKVLSRADNRRR